MTTFFVQLELFPETPEQKNAREIAELKRHCEKLRKSLYARNGDLAKAYGELRLELDQLKQSICKYETITPKQVSFL